MRSSTCILIFLKERPGCFSSASPKSRLARLRHNLLSSRIETGANGVFFLLLISRLFAEPQYDNLVDIHSVNPTIVVELRYATADNITGRRLCPKKRCADPRSAGVGAVIIPKYGVVM